MKLWSPTGADLEARFSLSQPQDSTILYKGKFIRGERQMSQDVPNWRDDSSNFGRRGREPCHALNCRRWVLPTEAYWSVLGVAPTSHQERPIRSFALSLRHTLEPVQTARANEDLCFFFFWFLFLSLLLCKQPVWMYPAQVLSIYIYTGVVPKS